MVLFYLTNASLEILSGITWWFIMKTSSGFYYIIYGKNKDKELGRLKIDTLEQANRIDELIQIQKSNQIQIKKLTDSINVLNDYIINANQMKQQPSH